MAVLCEALSVIVRADAIRQRYRGGWVAFERSIPNQTYCSDGELARIGFFSPQEVQAYVSTLLEHGLRFREQVDMSEAEMNDVVVVDQHHGPTQQCPWIEFTKTQLCEGAVTVTVSMCWLFEGRRLAHGIHVKDLKMRLATPAGWTPEGAQSIRFVPDSTSH